ncbi:MAG: deoxyribodipyrimidine photo-lyase [Alphaproteobacteria bacterium]|nr:deoxyribodipyrimidine photo-lyase [Alphaproteobacteria bacterium]
MNTPTLPQFASGLVWFRRDLRAHDQAALYHALRHCQQVHAAFVFDTDILAGLPRQDRRVEFIHESLQSLDAELRALAGHPDAGLIVVHGAGALELTRLAVELGVQAVFTNHDDEPDAVARDHRVRGLLAERGIALETFKDHVVFERSEVLTQSGTPYGVFTPYKRAWLKKVQEDAYYLRSYPVSRHAHHLAPRPASHRQSMPSLQEMGFEATNLSSLHLGVGSPGGRALLEDFVARMQHYGQRRDFPSQRGPSYLSVHLRFGTVSIRELARLAFERIQQGDAGAEVWLSELIWRDFYHQILFHHPHVVERAFKPEYDAIRWAHGKTAETHFQSWCEGRTGYPLVDAAMVQINQTGYMHNRLRMVVASFLTKDLGLHWQRGEAYFAQQLIDFDLAANNGGWQWASSSGCDAQPYFRIFNPISQSEKFDPEGKFIKRYLPQLASLSAKAIHAPWQHPLELQSCGLALGRDYPEPIVDHAQARAVNLARYAVVKK